MVVIEFVILVLVSVLVRVVVVFMILVLEYVLVRVVVVLEILVLESSLVRVVVVLLSPRYKDRMKCGFWLLFNEL